MMATQGTSELFEALAEHVDDLVFVTDEAMRMLYASNAFERETGFTVADFQFPQADNPFIHREDAEQVAHALAAFVGSDRDVSDPIENRFLDRWGRTHRCRTIVIKVAYRGEKSLLFVCNPTVRPTERSTEDSQYRALVESAEDAILRLDNAGRILFANRCAHRLLAYSATELGRLRLDDLVIPSDRERLTDQLTRSIGTREPLRFELGLRTKTDAMIAFSVVITPLGQYGHAGELLAILRLRS